jgi:phenylpyruvate tautomerase PptA (4-oxalocrotonate tautomerase family)
MPLVRLQTNKPLTPELTKELGTELSRAVAELIGKPERYVMTIVDAGSFMSLGGEEGAAAFIEVRSIGGLSPKVNAALCERLCSVTAKLATIAPTRIYLNFVDVAATNWGQDGRTFG